MKFFSPTRLYSSTISLITLAILGVGLIPAHPQELFANYQSLAQQKLETMTLDEKIGQILLVRYPENGIEELTKYQFGGYVFFEKDFRGKTAIEVQSLMDSLQSVAKVPILTSVDEEGGLVTRLSNNRNLTMSSFRSLQELYQAGGFPLISSDTLAKSQILYNLGLNLNLAPVVDVSTDPSDYMYSRSLGQDTQLTAEYAAVVISASQGTGVSYTLKHFPGYSNNSDTHLGVSVDRHSLVDLIHDDLPPFRSGIDAGAEAVLISHNIVSSIDSENPASLSPKVHQLLRDAMQFSGVIITDDIAMGATSTLSGATVRAIQAGNDLIITTDYLRSITETKSALQTGLISESQLDSMVHRILAWKYAKGLILE